jgi:hypothetical protein
VQEFIVTLKVVVTSIVNVKEKDVWNVIQDRLDDCEDGKIEVIDVTEKE